MLRPKNCQQNSTSRPSLYTFMAGRILLIECTNPLNKALHPPFLEKSHQGRSQCLASIWGHLRHSSLWSSTLLNVAACHLLELEISCDIRRYEDVCQLAAGHKELWYKVDVPVVNASVFLPGFLPLVVVAIFLEQLKEVRQCSQARGGLLTASMLTEAASLVLVSLFSRGRYLEYTLRSGHFGQCARPSCLWHS